MFVKICGITSEEDALLAVAMGADAVGFVFAPSTRQIAHQRASEIARRLPPEVMTVGVFRDESPERVVRIVNEAGLRAAQLHGHEAPRVSSWVSERVPVLIKAFAAGDPAMAEASEHAPTIVLVDGKAPGSGQVFDWSLAEGAPDAFPLLLAGGLDPDNVVDAITAVKPWGVDVSSGVERAPGQKDPVLVRRFVEAARSTEDDEDAVEEPRGPFPYDWQDEVR